MEVSEFWRIAKQLVGGVKDIHAEDLIHLDLKVSVLFTS